MTQIEKLVLSGNHHRSETDNTHYDDTCAHASIDRLADKLKRTHLWIFVLTIQYPTKRYMKTPWWGVWVKNG